MKIFGSAVLAVCCMPYSAAFVGPQAAFRPAQTSKLNLHPNLDGDTPAWAGPAAAMVAGLTLASQVAGASVVTTSPMEIIQAAPQMEQVQTSASSVFSGSSIYLSDDFLDFSMPSYGSSVGDSTAKAKASDNAPSFANPFSDFNFKAPSMPSFKSDDDAPAAVVEDKEVEQSRKAEEKAEEKAAAESQKAADKAAAEAQKADEKADQKAAKEAAAEAKKAEKEAAEAKKQADAEQAATKKAEKEARRQAELEKQRLAVERARENDEAPAPAPAPSPPVFKAPEVPDVKLEIPEFKAPDMKFDMPEFKAPDFKMPAFSAPKFSMPEIPKMDMPKVDMPATPSFDMPKGDMPKAPSFDMPKADMPKFDMPKFDMPKAPSFSMPETSFEMPKTPSFSAPQSSVEEEGESQEVRDESAKAARSMFNQADLTAKEVEKKAAELRSIANEKKNFAKEAKDEACTTRFGGKFLCIRPLNSGY